MAMVEEGLYFFELYTDKVVKGLKADKLYYQGQTKYQFVQIFYNQFYGKVLYLDKKIQSAQIDEFVYHESLIHPALFTHPHPRQVLIIGGGEGATLREALRHEVIQRAVMVDIDEELVKLCQKFLPEWSEGAFSNPKTELVFEDACCYLDEVENRFDVIISDLTEPVQGGPSVHLFTKEFFDKIFKALKKDGLFVLQAGSTDPFYHQFYSSCVKTLESVFPLVRPYWSFIFSFGLPWGFVLASKQYDPLQITEEEIAQRIKERKTNNLKFYHPPLQKGMFALPLYLTGGIKKGKVLTDKKPFIWKL